jgi:hypothetical protein
MAITDAFAAPRRAALPVHHTRGLVVSFLVVLPVAALVVYAVLEAFSVFGGNPYRAGIGAWVSLGISVMALVAALGLLFDLVYRLVTGEHIIIRPFGASEHQPERWLRVVGSWGPPVTVALGILIGKTVFT